MARAGLGSEWECKYANDLDVHKAASYIANWGSDHFDSRDIREVQASDLPSKVDLAWASFPCQDLSLAGNGLGLGDAKSESSTRSGALWPFLELLEKLMEENRSPSLVVLENVLGLLSLNGGRNFALICSCLSALGYKFGAITIDAKDFLPQSRPRVFIVAIRSFLDIPTDLVSLIPISDWHPRVVVNAFDALAEEDRCSWIWWSLGVRPKLHENAIKDVIKLNGVEWDSEVSTQRLLGMMSDHNLAKLHEAKQRKSLMIGSLYLRMRRDISGNRQCAEISFNNALGCLRTPKGGASRPRIIVVEDELVRTRLLSTREAAELMGLNPDYILPKQYSHAFKLIGDGVAVPVVRFLAERLLERLVPG